MQNTPDSQIKLHRFHDDRDWFFEKRFGLFLHWGLYAIEGWHEQQQWRARVPRDEYQKLAQQWNPEKFDPDQWLDLMQEVGMEYVCLTTKHHDGFCLWNTAQTDFNTMNTPYGRDIVAMLAQACQRRNVPLCLYYSCVDWNHPNYPNQGRHHELPAQPNDSPDHALYLEFLRAQVRELCTNYGPIHGFWWDMNVEEHVDPSINAMIRELQPQCVINNRGYDAGDFGTPERDYDEAGDVLQFERPTEACQSVSAESWGYRREDDFYSDAHLQRSIARYLARDANYLLNVGPMPDGSIAPESQAILRRLGTWYKQVREAFTGVTSASHLIQNRQVLLTRKDNFLYVILHKEPITEAVKLKPIKAQPRRATLLNTDDAVEWSVDFLPSNHTEAQPLLRLRKLPVNQFCNSVLVIKMEFDDLSSILSPPATAANVDEILAR
jgi:alpha-L-fucosidase